MNNLRRRGHLQWVLFAAPVRKCVGLITGFGLIVLVFYLATYMVTFNRINTVTWKSIYNPVNLNSAHYSLHSIERDIEKYTSQLISGLQPDVPPINLYDFPYIIENEDKCLHEDKSRRSIQLLIVVKSAVGNFERRDAIRQTWGWEERFPGIVIRCIFNLGSRFSDTQCQRRVEKEQQEHEDILQGNFTDSYHNNTIKTMMGFRWVVEHCPLAKFILFVDDDMYVSVKNVLQFASRPEDYPKYLQTNESDYVTLSGNHNSFTFDLNEPPTLFYAGHAKYKDPPLRVRNKWYISPSAYPFSIYPPYVPAGAYLLSFQTLRKMYYASMYTPHYMYDDVYLGMCAKRAGIVPFNNDYFWFWRKPTDYRYHIVAHGFGNATELIAVWKEQYKLQYA